MKIFNKEFISILYLMFINICKRECENFPKSRENMIVYRISGRIEKYDISLDHFPLIGQELITVVRLVARLIKVETLV